MCAGRRADSEKGYLKKLLEYGYLKTADDDAEPNVVIFDSAAKEHYSAETAARLSALKEDICALITQAPSVSRGYVVEQALENGWLRQDENTPDTIGAYIYL